MNEQLERWWSALSEEDRDYLAREDEEKMSERTVDLLMRGPIGPVIAGWPAVPESFDAIFPASVREFIESKSSAK